MVKNLNIALEDDSYERVVRVKNDLGLTWPEFVEVAATELSESEAESDRREQPRGVQNVQQNAQPVHTTAQQPRESEPREPRSPDQEEELDVPGTGPVAEARQDAIHRMAEYIREHGHAEKNELIELIDVDEVAYSSPASFWSNCVKGKATLHTLPGIEAPAEGGRRWRYSG